MLQSLHIQDISYAGYIWIAMEVFSLKTQEVPTFCLLVEAETIENTKDLYIQWFPPLPNNLPYPLDGYQENIAH